MKTNQWLEASVPCSAALLDETHFRQFRDPATETFSYLIGCCLTGQAAIIDPVISHVPLYIGVLKELALHLTWIFETHLHADHISAADTLREWTGARVAVGGRAGISCADSLVDDTDTLTIGALTLDVVATPGHTAGCVTYRWADRLFTGDSLLIGGCGSINEPGSSGLTLFDSVTRRLFCLADETLIYPGHCLNGRRVSCVGEERDCNPYFHGVSRDQFVAIKRGEPEETPATMQLALEANRCCGRLLQAETAGSGGVKQQV